MRVYIVGAGNVGLGMALALRSVGYAPTGVFCRAEGASAERVSSLLSQHADVSAFGPGLAAADLVLVCVTDSAIGEVGRQLNGSGAVKEGTVVAHTSGCHGAASLGQVAGAAVASLHPLVACPTPERAAKAFLGGFYAIEGEEAAHGRLQQVVKLFGGRWGVVTSEAKSRYHAAAVISSNLVVALLNEALGVAGELGIPEAREAFLDLAAGALEQVRKLGPVGALTGPLARGDVATVRCHLNSLPSEVLDVYRLLSHRALLLAAQKGLSSEQVECLRAALGGVGSKLAPIGERRRVVSPGR